MEEMCRQMPQHCPAAGDSMGISIAIYLVVSIILSVYVFVAYAVRWYYRDQIPEYDIVSDILGHGSHSVGMLAMGLSMLGAIPSFGSIILWSAVYGAFALVFLVRTVMFFANERKQGNGWRENPKWWWNPVHVVLNVFMVYMFQPILYTVPTMLILAFYTWFTALYVFETIEDFEANAFSILKKMWILTDSGHAAMGISMSAMFVTMQWPDGFTQSLVLVTFALLAGGLWYPWLKEKHQVPDESAI